MLLTMLCLISYAKPGQTLMIKMVGYASVCTALSTVTDFSILKPAKKVEHIMLIISYLRREVKFMELSRAFLP